MSHSLSPEQQVQRLRNQIGWVTRLSTALSSVKDAEDLLSIVLSGLMSPTGLSYSQVLFFEHDASQNLLLGKYALYHDSLQSLAALGHELEEESHFLEQQAVELQRSGTGASLPRTEEEVAWLASNAQWVTLFQRLNPDNPKTEQLKKLSFPTLPSQRRGHASVFDELREWRTPRSVTRSGLGGRIPHALAALLPEHFVIAPLASAGSLRAVLFLDKHLEGDSPVSRDELRELEWFCRQASLAIDNAEMTNDLATAYQELKQIDQMKSNFLSIISHELRTPLTAMGGFVDLILDGRVGEINENQRMLLGRVQKNTHHLSHLVNDLIELAQIEAAGAVETQIGPVEPLGVLMETLPKLEQRRRDSQARVVPVIECEIPMILTDARSLSRIFFHLIDNAMKFSPANSEVEVRFRCEGDEFFADIIDHGVGIAPENIRHIFKHFYQVDGSLTRGHEGLGLGLAVTKMLLQATHGRIEVRSEIGKGSIFTAIFPIAAKGNA